MNPPHRLAVGREQQDGAVVDDDLDNALVVVDAKMEGAQPRVASRERSASKKGSSPESVPA